MPSGWENAPEYGGRDPGPFGWIMIVLVLAGVAWGLFACQQRAVAQPQAALVGRASVIDGDTIEIRGQRTRLWGIDAPESSQTCRDADGSLQPVGRRSAFALAALIGENNVSCIERDRDRWGRAVSQCSVGGRDLSAAMVESGWAYAFTRYSRDYVQEERNARSAGLSVHSLDCERPWDFRRRQREQSAR